MLEKPGVREASEGEVRNARQWEAEKRRLEAAKPAMDAGESTKGRVSVRRTSVKTRLIFGREPDRSGWTGSRSARGAL